VYIRETKKGNINIKCSPQDAMMLLHTIGSDSIERAYRRIPTAYEGVYYNYEEYFQVIDTLYTALDGLLKHPE
jgi:hypothetical protein